jgi:hypothetical protein
VCPGNEHDSKRFEQVVGSIRINIGRGRPRIKLEEVWLMLPTILKQIRVYLRKRGIKSSIPEKKRNQKTTSSGRPTRFDKESYKNEDLLSDSSGGSNSDLGELLKDMRDSTNPLSVLSIFAAFMIIWRKI